MIKKLLKLFKKGRAFTDDEIFEALDIVSGVHWSFIKKEYDEEALPNSETPVEALAWIIGNCYRETGYIHFDEEPIIGG